MSRVLVRKVIIDDIEPMENADTIEVARVTGWRCVVKKGDFKKGDIALYFECDAALSAHDNRFEFLKERCYKKFNLHGKLFDECIRIRTMKLRGVLSQGLLMHPEMFCEVRNKQLGEDCSDVLAVRHYDEVAEKFVRETAPMKPADQKGSFPSCCPKTDEEHIQNVDDETLRRILLDDKLFEITEKMDGTSCTVGWSKSYRPDDPLFVCSRNFELKDMPSAYWDMVHKLELDKKLEQYWLDYGHEIAIQGELTGPGIQNNPDKQQERSFHVFRIWDIETQRWLDPTDRYGVCQLLGLNHVPVLEMTDILKFMPMPPHEPDKWCAEALQELRDNILKYADGKTANGNLREGVVFKAYDGSFSFKAVSNNYLLSQK